VCSSDLSIGLLRDVDPDFLLWYDDDRNIPDDATNKELTLLMENRLCQFIPDYKPACAKLYKGVYIWTDRYQYSKFPVCIFDTERNIHPYSTVQEAKQFIDRLTGWENLNDWKIAYGVFICDDSQDKKLG
jgi:hypothetical protein